MIFSSFEQMRDEVHQHPNQLQHQYHHLKADPEELFDYFLCRYQYYFETYFQ